MTVKPISGSRDPDLRLSQIAMERAARRARELAVRTGTALVVVRNGVVEHISPEPKLSGTGVQETAAPCRNTR
jgi:LDH2 family malate/lactate/ureidoglycolate dehydrogenase